MAETVSAYDNEWFWKQVVSQCGIVKTQKRWMHLQITKQLLCSWVNVELYGRNSLCMWQWRVVGQLLCAQSIVMHLIVASCTVGQYPLEFRQSHWWNYSNYILYSASNSTNDIAEVPVNW